MLKDAIQACMSLVYVPVFVQSHLSYISRLHRRFLFHLFLLALHADLKMYTNMKENSQSSPEQFNRFNFLPFLLFLMLLFLINLHWISKNYLEEIRRQTFQETVLEELSDMYAYHLRDLVFNVPYDTIYSSLTHTNAHIYTQLMWI